MYQLSQIHSYDSDDSDDSEEAQENYRKLDSLLEYQLDSKINQELPESILLSDIDHIVTHFMESIDLNNELINQSTNIAIKEENYDYQRTLEIRNYQYELYQQGIGKNCIIYLSTGLGKHQKLYEFPNKKIVFITNTIALCEQQAQQIRIQLPRVAELLGVDDHDIQYALSLVKKLKVIHGCKYPDHWSTSMWQLLFEKNQIFVMTAQLFVNLNRSGICHFEEYSFIVFDECHAAQSLEHAYNLIMIELYFPLKKQLISQGRQNEIPQIVGATASPITSINTQDSKTLITELLVLGARLDSIYLSCQLRQISSYLKEASVKFKFYQIPLQDRSIQQIILSSACKYDLRMSNPVYKKLMEYNIMPYYFGFRNEIEIFKRKYSHIVELDIIILQIENQVITSGFKLYLEFGQYMIKFIYAYVLEKLDQFFELQPNFEYKIQVKEIYQRIKEISQQFNQNNYQDWTTHKTKELVEFLSKIEKEQKQQQIKNKILIFIRIRSHAKYLNLYLKEIFANSDFKIEFILGHRVPTNRKISNEQELIQIEQYDDDDLMLTDHILEELNQHHSKFKTLHKQKEQLNKLLLFKNTINFQQQKDILKRFRSPDLDILISTSVTEEGIDIPMCNYVICLDQIQSSKAFIQMKGRARKDNSQFVAFCPQESSHEVKVEIMQKVESITGQLIEKIMNAQTIEQYIQNIEQIQIQTLKSLYYERYIVQESGAFINTLYSQHLVYQFCYSIINQNKKREQAKYAIYEIKDMKQRGLLHYQAFILLPYQIKGKIIFPGIKRPTLREAKASAAFYTAKHLLQVGYLDQYLRSVLSNDVGFHVGADENDSSIEMTQQQTQIFSQKCVKIQSKIDFTLLITIRTWHQYYSQISLSKIQKIHSQTNSYLFTFVKDNFQFQLISNDKILPSIQQAQSYLSQLGYKLESLETMSCERHIDLYQEYYKRISAELHAQQQKAYRISKLNAIFINADEAVNVSKITNEIILAVKLKDLEQVLLSQQVNWEIRVTKFNSRPYFIHQYIEFDSLWDFDLTTMSVNQEFSSEWDFEELEQETNFELSEILNQILIRSIRSDQNYGIEMVVGQEYFRLLLMLQMLVNNQGQYSQSFHIRSKKLRSHTNIKNCLLDLKIFQYLHSSNNEMNYFGVSQCHKQIPNNYKKISNHEFAQFVNSSCYHIYLHDNKMSLGFKWLDWLGITLNFNSILKNTDQLQNLIPQSLSQQQLSVLNITKTKIEHFLSYQFQKPELLILSLQIAMLPQLRKFEIAKKLKTRFKKEENKYSYDQDDSFCMDIINTTYEDSFMSLNFDQSNYIDQTLLVDLGKQLWRFMITRILQKHTQDYITHYALLKQLSRSSIIILIVIELGLSKLLTFGENQTLIDQLLQKLKKSINPIQDNSGIIEMNEAIYILTETFYAIYFSVFLDTNCDLERQEKFTNFLLNPLNIDYIKSERNLNSLARYRFLKWYEKKLGFKAQDFTLLKLPHLDYHQLYKGILLFIPYDLHKSQPVNLFQDNLENMSQLQIKEKSKQNAWEQLAQQTCDKQMLYQ